MSLLHTRDAIDLNSHVFRQPRHFHGCAGGSVAREVPSVDLVHDRELAHVLQVYGSLDHALQRRPGGFQHALQILDHALGLHADPALDDLIGCWIQRYLPAQECPTIGDHRLRIGADGFRRSLRRNNFFHMPLENRSVPVRSAARATFSRSRNWSSSRAIRSGACGSQKFAVPTSTALAPAIRNSAASAPVAIPPNPTTGIFTACAAS